LLVSGFDSGCDGVIIHTDFFVSLALKDLVFATKKSVQRKCRKVAILTKSGEDKVSRKS